MLTRTTQGSTPGAETNWREVNHSRPAPPSSPPPPRSSFSQALTATLVCRLVLNLRTRSGRAVAPRTGMASLTSVLTTFFDAEPDGDGAHLPQASLGVSAGASVARPGPTAKGGW